MVKVIIIAYTHRLLYTGEEFLVFKRLTTGTVKSLNSFAVSFIVGYSYTYSYVNSEYTAYACSLRRT